MERNGMIFSKSIFVLLVLLGLMASSCSDCDDGAVLSRYDDVGFMYSPTPLSGSVEYISTMTPEKIKVVTLDELLNPVDSFEIAAMPELNKTSVFSVNERDYEYPYVKLVPIFQVSEKFQMEFPQYVRLTENNSQIKLNLYASLASGRIEKLVHENKKSYDAAERQALSELATYFDDVTISANNRNFRGLYTVWNGDCLNDLKPYVYCRHEISDSIFYSDVNAFRKSFAKDGVIDSSWAVRAADTWLLTFKLVDGKNGKPELKTFSRDTAAGIKNFDQNFFGKIYGVTFPNVKDTAIAIENKWSSLKGRKFVYDKQKTIWRLSNPLEDTLGICFSTKDSLVENDGKYYLCAKDSVAWKETSHRETLLNRLYKKCDYVNRKKAVYLRDSLFVCECEKDRCAWTDKYVKSVFAKDDSLYSSYILATALRQFGPCDSSLKDKIEKVDSAFVWCSSKGDDWQLIDSLYYYLGLCSDENTKSEHQGVYYACNGLDEYGAFKNEWVEIPAPAYYGDTCSAERRKKQYVKKYDEDYFMCVEEICSDRNGNNRYCNKWRKLKDSEKIPPVINMDVCDWEGRNLKVVYDGVFYKCDGYSWAPVDEDSLLSFEKEGFFCKESLYGTLKKDHEDYYECNYINQWYKKTTWDSALLGYRDSLGNCDTISKKSLYWNERNSAFFGCKNNGRTYEWTGMNLASGSDSYDLCKMPESYERKNFAGGTIERDSIYTVTADEITYQFYFYLKGYPLSHAEIAGKGYDAYFYNDNLFIHEERPDKRLRAESLKNKSESFDAFYETWKTNLRKYSECKDSTATVDTVYFMQFDENAHMNWEKAKSYCPEGFHIPSSDEFKKNDYVAYKTTDMKLRNDSPLMWDYHLNICSVYGNLVYVDLFWTSTEKDDETQECFEYVWHHRNGEMSRRIVDCPKDLYPMVQTLCVKDK